MAKLATLCLALAVSTTMVVTAVADTKKYTLADLKALVAQKSYREALEHAADVSPADRKADWVDVIAEASGALLATVEPEVGLSMIDQVDREYPALLKNAKYTKARNEVGVKGLGVCFANEYGIDECLKVAKRFLDNSTDATLSLKVAKVARLHMNSQATVPLFERAITASKTACKDADAKIAVVAGLGMPPDDAIAKTSRTLATTCYDDMKTEVQAAFDKDDAGYVGQNTCALLTAKKAISGLQAKRCQKK